MDDHEAGVTDEERGSEERPEDSISVATKCGFAAWGFIFGLMLGLLLGAIPLCFLKNEKREIFYMIGWGIGGSISLVVFAIFTL